MPHRKSTLLLALLVLNVSSVIQAQNWQWALSSSDTLTYSTNYYGKSEATDAAGNVYVLATGVRANMTFGPTAIHNPDPNVALLVKFDSSGNYEWESTIYATGAVSGNQVWGMAIATDASGNAFDASGNVYVTGYANEDTVVFGTLKLVNNAFSTASGQTAFLTKFDASGNALWAKNINGGGAVLISKSITTDSSHNIYLTGTAYGTGAIDTLVSDTVRLTYGPYGQNAFLLKFDSSGHTLWGREPGNSGGEISASAGDPAGNTWLWGSINGPAISFDTITLYGSTYNHIFLVKYNSSGKAIWATAINDPGSIFAPWGIAVDPNDNAYVTVQYYLGDSATIGNIKLRDTISNYIGEMLLVKYDSAGQVRWVKKNIDTAINFTKCIAVDDSANVYAAGLDSTKRFYLAKYDSAGNNQWIMAANAGSICYPQTITTDPWANVYVMGDFTSSNIDFGSISLTNTGPGIHTPNLFLAKESRLKSAGVINIDPTASIKMYPNPATDQVTIAFPNSNQNTHGVVMVTNLLGQEVKTCSYNTSQVQINIADLAPGVYLVRINGGEVRKLVKE